MKHSFTVQYNSIPICKACVFRKTHNCHIVRQKEYPYKDIQKSIKKLYYIIELHSNKNCGSVLSDYFIISYFDDFAIEKQKIYFTHVENL